MRSYFVYLMASESGTLYIGVTNDLERRVFEHKSGLFKGFSKKYKISKLLYYEEFDNIYSAIEREKQIKKWSRSKKIKLFKSSNPGWVDLSKDWFRNSKQALSFRRSGKAATEESLPISCQVYD